MTILVLVVLAALWAAVLLPPVLRNRGSSGPSGSSIGDFAHRIAAIGKTGGWHRRTGTDLPAVVPGPSSAAPAFAPVRQPAPRVSPAVRKRRRDVLTVLAATASAVLLLAVVLRGALLWLMFGVALLALLGYVVLLRRAVAYATFGPGPVISPVPPVRNIDAAPALTNVRFLPQGPPPPSFALRQSASS